MEEWRKNKMRVGRTYKGNDGDGRGKVERGGGTLNKNLKQ